MGGSASDARLWRERILNLRDSAQRLDGESGLEFCESVGVVFGRELEQHAPESQSIAELVVAAAVVAVQRAAAEAFLAPERPRRDIEQILLDGLDSAYAESESWISEGLDDSEIAGRLAASEVEIERCNARVRTAAPGKDRNPLVGMDFDELLAAQGRDTRMVIFEIARTVSPELYAFMLNAPSFKVLDHIPDDTQREVIAELIVLLRALPGYPYELRTGSISDLLIKYDAALGTSRATHYHVKCGGEWPVVAQDNSLASALKTVAMDFLGARLCDESTLMNVLPTHPLHHDLIYRVMKDDEPIAELFKRTIEGDPGLSEAERQRQSIYLPNVMAHWSDSSGGTIDIRHVPEAILSALNLACDTSGDVLSQVCEAVDESLALARKLAMGEPVTTVALVGLANVTLDTDVACVDLPGMHIRPPSVFEKIPYANQPTAIAEVTTELRMVDVQVQAMDFNDDRIERLHEFATENERLKIHDEERRKITEAIAESILQLRFAMALASPQRRLIGPIWLYTTYRNPLTGWGGNSLRPSSDLDSAFSDQVIDRITAARIADCCVPTSDLHPSLRIGRARILQGLSDRKDPIDSFIDFVIAWESMVGYDESTTFLVSATMSLLLAPEDVEKRKELFANIRKLYTNRSNLVHGSAGRDHQTKYFKVSDIKIYADDAGRLAIDTFKRIIRRPELMSLDAKERVKMVLLGFPK